MSWLPECNLRRSFGVWKRIYRRHVASVIKPRSVVLLPYAIVRQQDIVYF